MKRHLLLLGIAAAGAAHAQSSVTVFGLLDATIAYGSASGAGSASKTQLTNSSNNASRLGFRGVEDLGGGLSASFWLEAAINNDNGSGNGTNTNNQASGSAPAAAGGQGLTFGRRSTVSLSSALGEVRLGRDYSPQFWNLALFEPFAVNGVGTTQTFNSIITGVTSVRASNSIGYFLPQNIGGVYGQAMVYMGENVRNGLATEKDGNGLGARLGYASGPFNAAIALSRTKYAAGNVEQNNLGASWLFGAIRVMGHYSRDKNGTTSGSGWLVGATIPVGTGEFKAAFSQYTTDVPVGDDPRTRKLALGYIHNLSKRTAVYITGARLSNSSGAAQALNGAIAGAANRSSTGMDVGVRHSF
jgi:predicted porin